MRSRVESALLLKPRAFWETLARKQISAAAYRLIFRQAFYDSREGRNQLPLPPAEAWTIALDRGPKHLNIDGHRLIGVEYTLSGVLVSDPSSPASAEPRLARIGGKWRAVRAPRGSRVAAAADGFCVHGRVGVSPNSVDEESAQFSAKCSIVRA